jgi:HlyD family secretion protein
MLINGMALNNTFSSTHGNEIDEIISNRLPFVVRWGTTFFACMLLVLTAACWFIKYPDIVTGKATLTGTNTPKAIISRTDGRLQKIHVQEGDTVEQGLLLGSMESMADAGTVLATARNLDTIAALIANNRTDEIVPYFPALHTLLEGNGRPGSMGELQPAYQVFIQAFIAFKDFLGNGYYLRKKKMLELDLQTLQKMQAALTSQQTLLNQDADLSAQTFKANEKLHEQKVIAAFEYRSEQSKLIAKQLSLPQAATALLNNQSQQNEKHKEIAELENQVQVQKNSFIQALQTMQSHVQAWQYKYLLKAPVAGTVAFAGLFQEGQELKANQTLFYVQPANSSYFAEMIVPQYNFGKVKTGQRVLLKFHAYPYEQYGQLSGTVSSVSNVPTDSGYLAKILLPNGLVTNYKMQLLYHNGLQAQADIVTQDMRLLERFYNGLKKQFIR